MGQLKKAYMNWCDLHGEAVDDEVAGNLEQFDARWVDEFTDWLTSVSAKNPITDAELTTQQQQGEHK